MTQQHQQQIQQHQPMHPSDHESRIGILENGVAGIISRLENISNKIDSRDKVPWGALIGSALGAITLIVTLISGIGALAFSPLSNGMTDLKSAIVKMEARADRYVPREDLDARFSVISQRRDDLQRLTDARVERIERDTDTIAKQVVPRAEHDSYRQLQQRDYDLLRNRLDRVEGRFEKRTDGLGRDIEKLEDRTLSRSEALSRNDAQDRITGAIRSEVDEHVRAFNERQQRRIDTLETPLIRSRP